MGTAFVEILQNTSEVEIEQTAKDVFSEEYSSETREIIIHSWLYWVPEIEEFTDEDSLEQP